MYRGAARAGPGAVNWIGWPYVRSKHIKNGQVKKADLGAGSVSAVKVSNGSLLAEDFGPGQLPAGPRGLKGDKGEAGAPTRTSGYVPMTASTGAGTTASLLTIGPVSYSANCKDNGGGQFRLEIRIASTEAGTIAASRLGNLGLTGTPQQFWFAQNTVGELSSQRQHVITPSGAGVHRSDVIVGIHKFGSDCITRVDAEI
ncbi:MAG: hypothetical protein QOH76_3434 [Thermoleophilaceae bacterium]|jgi:hypothetical protein|nr:hypothetical protein [Thermoleophilaceae bacterium]